MHAPHITTILILSHFPFRAILLFDSPNFFFFISLTLFKLIAFLLFCYIASSDADGFSFSISNYDEQLLNSQVNNDQYTIVHQYSSLIIILLLYILNIMYYYYLLLYYFYTFLLIHHYFITIISSSGSIRGNNSYYYTWYYYYFILHYYYYTITIFIIIIY